MKLTEHAKAQGEERSYLAWKAFEKLAEKLAKKALENGITTSQTAGSLNRYLNGLYLKGGLNGEKANGIRIYGYHVYLFKGSLLITVFSLPNKYKKTVSKLIKQIK